MAEAPFSVSDICCVIKKKEIKALMKRMDEKRGEEARTKGKSIRDLYFNTSLDLVLIFLPTLRLF